MSRVDLRYSLDIHLLLNKMYAVFILQITSITGNMLQTIFFKRQTFVIVI